MLFYTRWTLESVFGAIDNTKERILKCKNKEEIKVQQNVLKQYEDFLKRIEIGENRI